MTTHITYATAKRLKEFCPELPDPIVEEWYTFSGGRVNNPFRGKPPAYQLHDLLGRDFCEKMALKIEPLATKGVVGFLIMHIAAKIFGAYFNGGLPAVEAELCRMMEGR